jgi:hypothetical protein
MMAPAQMPLSESSAPPASGHRCLKRDAAASLPHRIVDFFAGYISRSTLLFRLLPLSLTCFFGTFIFGAHWLPGHYDWRKRVMSHVISPAHNPDAYWLPAMGIAAAAVLTLPFAGYVQRRLRQIMPRVAQSINAAFALGLLLVVGAAIPLPGMGRLHETFARASAAAIALGMLGCCVCALKDRSWFPGGRPSLCGKLALCWTSLAFLPVAGGVVSGILLLGRKAHLESAVRISQVLRPTVLWQLAFWEWAGVVALFAFLFLSVLWLPKEVMSPVPLPAPARSYGEADPERQNSLAPAPAQTACT